MPILLVFILTAACMPVDWPEPLLDLGRTGSASLTLAAVALSLSAAFAVRTWVVRTLRDPARRVDVANGYGRLRQILFFVNIGLVALAVLGLGWGATVRAFSGAKPNAGWDEAFPGAELLVPLPYFLILFGCWLIYYDAERELHRVSGATGPFWSRAGYFANHLRQLALLVGIPVGLFVTQQSLGRTYPETAKDELYRAASIAVVPVLILLMPLVIKPLLGLRSLPAGPIRDRLQAIADRLHFRCTDFLLWPTHGAAANAMIVGLIPQVRYVIFTDRLLEEMPPDELDAVFGHEVGHAKHGHIWYYAVFLALSLATIAALLLVVGQALDARVTAESVERWRAYFRWLAPVPVAVVTGYVFLVFGFLSRRCERQADVYGCRTASCGNPACTGHDADTVYPPRAAGLCPTGIRTCARALDRVYLINGFGEPESDRPAGLRGLVRGLFGWLRAWQHSTMPRRVAFVLSLIDDPGRERRFQRGVKLLRWGLILGLTAALVALGSAAGWRKLLEVL